MCRIANIMSQNRYMKNIVHTFQRIRQGQLIGHGPFLLYNLERSHEPRREFSTLSKLDGTLVQFHPQEDSITNFITTISAMRIDITLLSIMCFLDPFYYRLHFLFQLLDRFWSYQDPILKLIPT